MVQKSYKCTADTPKWWDNPPRTPHLREIEDALADLIIDRRIDPKAIKKDDIKFDDLLYYLKCINERWNKVDTFDWVPNKHVCFKGLWQIVNRLRK